MNAAQHVHCKRLYGGEQECSGEHFLGGVMQTTDAIQKRSKFYDYTSTQWICEINCKCLQYSMCARLKSKKHTTLQQQREQQQQQLEQVAVKSYKLRQLHMGN